MERPSRGHELFEAWLISTYGVSTRKPGRPRFEGLRETKLALRKELRAISSKLKAPKNAIALYQWLASAKPTALRCPPRHTRFALERVTDGAVPQAAWEQPGSEPMPSTETVAA